MADSTINIFGSSGEAMVGADTINTILASMDSKLTSDDINIETLGDGTVDVDVKNDTYTINLNHTHENMAKLELHTQATLPVTKELDTIYAQVDNVTVPTEVQRLFIGSAEFVAGAVETGEPQIVSPSNTVDIDMGYDTNGVFTKLINVKAKNISQAITVAVSGTGYSLSYGQLTGQSSITISAADALLGALITIVCDASSSSNEKEEGTLVITSAELLTPSSANLVAQLVRYEELTAVKLTGTQWLQTDYHPNPNTEFELDCQFEVNSNSDTIGSFGPNLSPYFIGCVADGTNRFNFQVGSVQNSQDITNHSLYRIAVYNNDTTRTEMAYNTSTYPYTSFVNRSVMMYKKLGSSMMLSFNGQSMSLPLKANRMASAMMICRFYNNTYGGCVFNRFNFVIYGFKIIENGAVVRNYVPKTRNGIAGLYDVANDTFISSEVSGQELVAIP